MIKTSAPVLACTLLAFLSGSCGGASDPPEETTAAAETAAPEAAPRPRGASSPAAHAVRYIRRPSDRIASETSVASGRLNRSSL